MANYTVRVDLHGADEDDYASLHAAMDEQGFVRWIEGKHGKDRLPTAEYNMANVTVAEQLRWGLLASRPPWFPNCGADDLDVCRARYQAGCVHQAATAKTLVGRSEGCSGEPGILCGAPNGSTATLCNKLTPGRNSAHLRDGHQATGASGQHESARAVSGQAGSPPTNRNRSTCIPIHVGCLVQHWNGQPGRGGEADPTTRPTATRIECRSQNTRSM